MASVPVVPSTPDVARAREAFHPEIVIEVAEAVAREKVVVVGMAWNQAVRKARAQLEKRGVAHRYLEYGNYITGWRKRLALKLWAGWPTFPMVFVNGSFLGGSSNLRAAVEDGTFQRLYASPRP
jgi:glutaredoxin-related protein